MNLLEFSFRVLWAILFCFAVFYGYLLYTPFLDTWYNEPTVIATDQADFPVQNLPFPAITICSNNKIVYRQLESVLRTQPWKGLNQSNYNITQETTNQGEWESIDGKLYHFSQERITFAKAKATCEHNFGKLFEPKTAAINDKIAAIGRDKLIINPWLGIRHLHDENLTVFVSDNTPVAWSYWDAKEPNNVNASEECTHLYTPSEYYNPTLDNMQDFISQLYTDRPELFEKIENQWELVELFESHWSYKVVEDCNLFSHPLHNLQNEQCNDYFNSKECSWDGDDCCGSNVKTVDSDGNPTCSSCECLDPAYLAKWNDNSCEEFRKFICEKDGSDSTSFFVYNYKPASFEEDFVSALTALVTAQDNPQRLIDLSVGAKSLLNDYQYELPKILKQVMQTCSGITDDGVGMFLDCYWYGKQYECSELFKLRPTDSGFCCSFNTLAMEEQFKNGSKWTGGIENIYTDPCQDWIDHVNMKLTSPNYPEPYGQLENCTWNITAPPEHFVTIDFEIIDLRHYSDGDYISIQEFDSNKNRKSVVAYLTGPDEGPKSYSPFSNWQKKIISISTNMMIIDFIPEGAVSSGNVDRGFLAYFYFTKILNNECESWLDMQKKIIKSPNYPGLYQNSIKCRWLLNIHHDYHITLNFIEFHSELGDKSYLKVYDGGSEQAEMIANFNEAMNGTRISTPRNQIFIVFDINGNIKLNAAIIENDKCQYWLDETAGVLTSPYFDGFDQYYYNNLNCTWILKAEQGSFVNFEVNFDWFILAKGDSLSIFDGKHLQSQQLAKLDRSITIETASEELLENPHKAKTISSTGKDMLVQFSTTDEHVDYGFRANFQFVPYVNNCENWLNKTSSHELILKSPTNAANDCNWLISGVENTTTINIHFEYFEVKNAFNFKAWN